MIVCSLSSIGGTNPKILVQSEISAHDRIICPRILSAASETNMTLSVVDRGYMYYSYLVN